MFLTQLDFQNHQRDGDLDVLTNGGIASVGLFAEAAAVEEMKSYLALRFDVAVIFIDVDVYSSTKAYLVNDMVWVDDAGTLKHFVCIQDGVGQNPLTAAPYWVQNDIRNARLVMIGVDIAVYHMYAKVPNRQTPQDVIDRYLDAIKWLEGVAKGLYKPTLPLLDDTTTPTARLYYGSKDKLDNSW